MFYIIGKEDTKSTFTVFDTEDFSTEIVNKDEALEFFKKTGIEYRVLLNYTMQRVRGYCLLYTKTTDGIKGVLFKKGKYEKAIGIMKECTGISLNAIRGNVTLTFYAEPFGVRLISHNKYTSKLELVEEGQWKRW